MSTELTEKQAAELTAIDDAIVGALASVEATAGGRHVARAVALARAAETVLGAIRRYWPEIAPLKDTPYGFATDESTRQHGPYTPQQIQQALAHGILLGGMPTGGEITVISGRAYLSLPHFERWSRECEGLTDLVITPGVPTLPGGDGGTALVEATASYVYRGVPTTITWSKGQAFDGRIPVKVNKGMGPDAVLGKARRKILAAIRKRVQGAGAKDEALDDDDGRTVVGSVVVDAAPAITQAPALPGYPGEQPSKADLEIAIKQYVATLATLDEISACSRLYEQYFGEPSAYFPHWTQARKGEAARRRDERVEQIRAGRGQRSNGRA